MEIREFWKSLKHSREITLHGRMVNARHKSTRNESLPGVIGELSERGCLVDDDVLPGIEELGWFRGSGRLLLDLCEGNY